MAGPLTLARPVPCPISAGPGAHFGAPAALGGGIHTGLDLSCAIGTVIRAPAPGVLLRRWFSTKSGTCVELQHDGFTTRYLHLSGVTLPQGTRLELGQAFAKTGASGTLVTGPHLHFEVLVNGVYVDPEPLLFGTSSAGVDTSGGSLSAYPREPGKSCPAGYNAGTVDPGILGNVPFNVWFGRPRNPDGTVDACIRVGLQPGDNAAVAQVGADAAAAFGAVAGAAIPVAVNVGVVVLVVVLAIGGLRQTLSAGLA